jgi:hypothetical protein
MTKTKTATANSFQILFFWCQAKNVLFIFNRIRGIGSGCFYRLVKDCTNSNKHCQYGRKNEGSQYDCGAIGKTLQCMGPGILFALLYFLSINI